MIYGDENDDDDHRLKWLGSVGQFRWNQSDRPEVLNEPNRGVHGKIQIYGRSGAIRREPRKQWNKHENCSYLFLPFLFYRPLRWWVWGYEVHVFAFGDSDENERRRDFIAIGYNICFVYNMNQLYLKFWGWGWVYMYIHYNFLILVNIITTSMMMNKTMLFNGWVEHKWGCTLRPDVPTSHSCHRHHHHHCRHHRHHLYCHNRWYHQCQHQQQQQHHHQWLVIISSSSFISIIIMTSICFNIILESSSSPAFLLISGVEDNDVGRFRCRVDFRTSQVLFDDARNGFFWQCFLTPLQELQFLVPLFWKAVFPLSCIHYFSKKIYPLWHMLRNVNRWYCTLIPVLFCRHEILSSSSVFWCLRHRWLLKLNWEMNLSEFKNNVGPRSLNWSIYKSDRDERVFV